MDNLTGSAGDFPWLTVLGLLSFVTLLLCVVIYGAIQLFKPKNRNIVGDGSVAAGVAIGTVESHANTTLHDTGSTGIY